MFLHTAKVTVGPGLDSEYTPKIIEPNQKIEIVEVKLVEKRIVGRIKEGGWVSLASNEENAWVWAELISNDQIVAQSNPF